MTKLSHEDQDLVNFIRQHRPEVPAASHDLEQQILQQVELPLTPILSHRSRSQLWLVPPAIAAGLLAAIVSYRSFVPPPASPAELSSLEAFIESNWQSTVSNEHLDSVVWHITDSDTE